MMKLGMLAMAAVAAGGAFAGVGFVPYSMVEQVDPENLPELLR